MTTPRVLHFAPLGGISGALRSMQVLVGELAKRGPTFVVALQEDDHARSIRQLGAGVIAVFAEDAIPRYRLPRWSRIVATAIKVIRRQKIDVIHCHSAQLMRYAWPASVVTGAPIVCHQRELYERLWTQRGLGRAHRIVAISEVVRASLPDRWMGRTSLIYNAVVGPAAIAPQIQSPMNRPLRVGVAGRVIHDKGQDLLVAAAGELMDRFDLEVDIWGLHPRHPPNDYARSLLAQIEALGHKSPRFHVDKIRDDMERFYQCADVVVVPSRCIEGLGRVAIEAMAWGCPVIVAGHGGLTETVQHESNGLTFRPGDWQDLKRQLDRLLSDPALRQRLRTRAREDYLRRFTPNAHATQIADLYAQLLDVAN